MHHLIKWPLAVSAKASFVTQPDFAYPDIHVTYQNPDHEAADGYYFLSPRVVDPRGLMIFDKNLDLVYMDRHYDVIDAMYWYPQKWNGENKLVAWSGNDGSGMGFSNGSAKIFNQDYTLNKTLKPEHFMDGHEFWITPEGNTTVSTSYEIFGGQDVSMMNHTYGLKNGFIVDSCFQELDLEKGEAIFRWCPHEHGVPYNWSYVDPSGPPFTDRGAWDWFHMNAVQKDILGNYFVNTRYLHKIFYIDGKTKKILWTLGGKDGNFTGDGTHFAWQHHVRVVNETNATPEEIAQKNKNGKRYISIFDNESYGSNNATEYNVKSMSHSVGRIIEIDFAKKTAKLIRKYENPGGQKNLLASSQGALHLISNYTSINSTNVIMSYGAVPVIAEYLEDGTSVRVIRFSKTGNAQAYRVLKFDWKGYPATKPDVAIKDGKIYVSWNGATEVSKWVLLQSKDTKDITKGTKKSSFEKKGFESSADIDSDYNIAQIEARDKDGHLLGKSDVIDHNNKSQGGGKKGKIPSSNAA
ncbi:hypothetical protein MCAP1_003388 [Malassezia caprae]|uniref:Arylsulfotransferase n=1 Tax=Malassezia caprae TaxID=1381934 RepID=A0AAF0EAL8_9BASI|nr:hypothetical protein MCAP1_003388 [Malassezia caprae]